AATELNLVLAAEPDNDRVRYYLASVYAETKEYAKALDIFEKIKPDAEYYVDSRVQIAAIYQKQGKKERASSELEHALAVKGRNPELLSYMGAIYREQKNYPKAIAAMEEAVAIDQNDDKQIFSLGALYDEAKNKPKAIELMQRAIAINPQNAAAL